MPHTSIQDILRTHERYLRSVHLDRDFDDAALLKQYVLTPPMVSAFSRIAEGLRPKSGRRAWRITGDYGSGKSFFALMLAHLLYNQKEDAVSALHDAIHFNRLGVLPLSLTPILITGAREGLVQAVARGVHRAIENESRLKIPHDIVVAFCQRVDNIIKNGDPQLLLNLLKDLAAISAHSGILLVLDRFRKTAGVCCTPSGS